MFSRIIAVLFLFIFSTAIDVYSQTLQWRNLPNSPYFQNGRMEDVYFINPNTGWTVLFSGKVFKSTNGGNNWDTVFISSTGSLRSIGFFDSQTGLLGTLHDDSSLVLFRTTNGGTNFTAVTDLPSPRIKGVCGIYILNENIAYACGRWDSPAGVIKTTDKGITWISFTIDTLLAKSIVDCFFWSPDSGVAVGGSNPNLSGNAVVLKTNDGGNSWQQVYRSSRSGEFCWKVSFVNRNLGYVSIQGISLYYLKTTDGGNTWTDNLFRAFTQQGIGFINENTGWIGGWTGPNYETTDAGISWHTAGWGVNVNRFRFINDTIAYAVGQRVYKYSRENVGINLSTSQIPERYNLSQNFPNPFNPVTKIKFDITRDVRRETQDVKLIVYDALGKEVATLVNEKLSSGSYEVEFDARDGQGSNFSSGIYFYKIETGNFIETKKMMLIK